MQKQFILTKQFTEGLKKVQTTDKNKENGSLMKIYKGIEKKANVHITIRVISNIQ